MVYWCMDKDKQKFWDNLREPIFVHYDCHTCMWSNRPDCEDIDGTGCMGLEHPRDNPNNLWEWDGKTYEDGYE